jgi:hypothetical protein
VPAGVLIVVASALAVVVAAGNGGPDRVASVGFRPGVVHVTGGRRVEGTTGDVVLRGVGRSGTECACLGGRDVVVGRVDAASVAAIAGRGARAVRLPLEATMTWLDERHVGYLAWAWRTWSGCSGPGLITSYDGAARGGYAQGVRAHLRSREAVQW